MVAMASSLLLSTGEIVRNLPRVAGKRSFKTASEVQCKGRERINYKHTLAVM